LRLKERFGDRRLRFTDVERRRLARRAHALGRKALSELDTLVTPDTLMRWYRTLVAQKWTYTHRRGPGRPRTIKVIVQLILRMALENRSWGYTRIQGALANLGHDVGRGTIANVLSEHCIDPAPERGKHTSWSIFLKAHWESALGEYCRHGFLHGRGFYAAWFGHALRSLHPRLGDPDSEDCRYHCASA
jgi:putative transposase